MIVLRRRFHFRRSLMFCVHHFRNETLVFGPKPITIGMLDESVGIKIRNRLRAIHHKQKGDISDGHTFPQSRLCYLSRLMSSVSHCVRAFLSQESCLALCQASVCWYFYPQLENALYRIVGIVKSHWSDK